MTRAYDDQGVSVQRTFTAPQQVRSGVQNGNVGYLHNIVAIAAGDFTSYALAADGTVYSWGYNEHGELGNGYYNETYVCGSWAYSRERAVRDRGAYNPVQVSNLSNIVSIAAGRDYAVALDASGNVYYWGNSAGYFYSAANVASALQ